MGLESVTFAGKNSGLGVDPLGGKLQARALGGIASAPNIPTTIDEGESGENVVKNTSSSFINCHFDGVGGYGPPRFAARSSCGAIPAPGSHWSDPHD